MQRREWVVVVGALAGCGAPKPEADNAVVAPQQRAEAQKASPPVQEASPKPKPAAGHPCNVQDGEAVTHRLKAVGTEPFWAAEVDGRCVTYKTPEDQQGTRIWTHVDPGPDGPAFNGALNGRQFQLYLKPSAGCSDGMSDRTYPLDAVLRVNGETRKGCAQPL